MRYGRCHWHALFCCVLFLTASQGCTGQEILSWTQVKALFESNNPALQAGKSGVEEMHANEITAFLRPNPQFTLAADGTQIASHDGVWQPTRGTFVVPTISYLHERNHKRELRLQSAQEGTRIASSQYDDLKRNLEFDLHEAFVTTLEAKAVLKLAKADLDYYDKIIDVSKSRYQAGDISQVDLDRIELLRVQYEAEIQSAIVNLRTSKIQLLQLLDDRTPVDKFDVDGTFDTAADLQPLDYYHQIALDSRPDLQADMQAAQQAVTNHKLAIANGSTDPTISGWYTWNSSNNNPNGLQTIGGSVSIPLRVFDHNQGEKERTLIDVRRSQQITEATRAQIFSDVDSAYTQVQSSLALIAPYKTQYKDQATRVRDTVTYAYEHGGASLMDFLNAQSEYRVVELAYLQLIGSYLTAADQLNLAVGREVLQ
jgi:cobalt-zinc-cadmium efflux system outer membrane protein